MSLRQLTMRPTMDDVVEAIGVEQARDQRLVELAGRGDRDAFAALVETRIGSAVRTASAILGNEADARDAVQEAFVSAWVNLPRLRDVGRFDPWLSRIVINRCRDTLRRRNRSREVGLDSVTLTGVLEPDLDLTDLNAAFERLNADQRHILVLHHLHQEPVASIAQRLAIPVGTAKWRLHAARRALEKALEAQR
jgi:RNA polymerase sigma-70 factor (ECF subfamily)